MSIITQDLTIENALTRIAELEAELQRLKTANQRLESFNQIGELVSAALNSEQALAAILSLIAESVPFDSATLMLVEGDALRAIAAHGFKSDHLALNVYPRSSRNSAWRVVQEKKPLVISDVHQAKGWESRAGLKQIRAWMGIPLIVKDEVIAVLTLDSNQRNTYTAADAKLVSPLGYQVAMAVENAFLSERLNVQRRQMIQLQKFNHTIASVLDFDDLLQVVMQQTTEILGSNCCSLWLLDKSAKTASVEAWYGFDLADETQFQLKIIVAQHSAIQKIFVENKAFIVEQDALILRANLWLFASDEFPLLVIPLRYKEKNIGFMVTENTENREAFLADKLTLAMNVAHQTALSIRAARLFDEIQKQAGRLQVINKVSHQITTVLNADELYAILAGAIYEQLNHALVAIFEVDTAEQIALLKAIRGERPDALRANEYRQNLAGNRMKIAVQSGQTVLATHIEDEAGRIISSAPEYLSGIVVPIFLNNRLGALLTVHSRAAAAFDENDVWTLETLAREAAIALENARLYRNATNRLNELAVLHEAGQAFISTLDLDEILAIIMQRTCAALEAEYGYALLTNENQNEATFVTTVGPKAHLLKRHVIPLVGSVMGTVVKQGKALRINDTASLPQFFVEVDTYINDVTRSLMVAPLKSKNEILGAMIVTNKQGGKFTENNLNLLTSLSRLASGAIDNARLFRQVQEYSLDLEEAVRARTAHLTAVNETSRTISSIVAMDEFFAGVAHLISDLFNDGRTGIGLRTGNYITFQTIYNGNFANDVIPANHRLRISRTHVLGKVVLTGEAALIETISAIEIFQLDDDDEAPSTMLAVPLTIGGKTTGVIVVQSHSWLASQAQDLETLASVASQAAVALENARLLQKSREMAVVQERTRLARDMHDGIAQNLAYLLLKVDRCIDLAESNSPKLEEELENMSRVISHNIEELRRHIFDLRPVGLEGRSIYTVAKQLAREFGEQTGIYAKCEIVGEEINLPTLVEAGLYRILQEALSNIRRHAHCEQVNIVLQTNPSKSIAMIIKDDGIGFSPEKVSRNPFHRHGLGLVSMQERVRGLGGTVLIESAPGHGTVVRVDIPNL